MTVKVLSLSTDNKSFREVPIEEATVKSFIAGESISDGDFINIYNLEGPGGGPRVRKAKALIDYRVDGFVLIGLAEGELVEVSFEAINDSFVGLSVGERYFISDVTPGGVVSVAPTGAGKMVQSVGKAVSSTEIYFESSEPIVLG